MVDRISQQESILFDGAVDLLKSKGYDIINAKPNLAIKDSINAWANIKFVFQAQDKNYLPAKQYQEFEYVYLRSLFEGEDFASAVERFMPYRERYIKNINLFDSDLSTYITGYSDSKRKQIVQTITYMAECFIYSLAAHLFKDKKSETEYWLILKAIKIKSESK